MEVTVERLTVGEEAPDFSLPDYQGVVHTLSHIISTKNALLVFNIGFA
jgi:peroxiredoxin